MVCVKENGINVLSSDAELQDIEERNHLNENELPIEEYGDHNSMAREDNDDRRECLEMMEERSESQEQVDALLEEFAHYFNGEKMWDGPRLFELLDKYEKAVEERTLEIYAIPALAY